MTNLLPYELALLLASFVYIVTPGPVFLAIISLVSEKGKNAGFKFVSGAILGCMVWLLFTCTSLIEAGRFPDIVFTILAFSCASYLFFLGGKMCLRSIKKDNNTIFDKPFKKGLTLALLNPKSYPVMTSLFSGVAVNYENLMQWGNIEKILVLSVFGFSLGYAFMVLIASFAGIKTFYIENLRGVSICFGLIFIYFGISLIIGTVQPLNSVF
jgi:threonine/homoserine/homoserine lactone efflux protein